MNIYYIGGFPISDELYHHGIKGQKWGIRRYQNEDGSLTADGRVRYGGNARNIQRDLNRLDKEKAYTIGDRSKALSEYKREMTKLKKHNNRSDKWKAKHEARAEKADERRGAFEKRFAELDNDTRRLVKRAIDQGMNVKISAIPRDTARFGERFAKSSLAWTMAIGTGMFLPVGIGIYTSSYVHGSKYSVKKPK